MSIVEPGPMEPMVGDPDDHRPDTLWRMVVDPGDPTTVVEIGMLERNPAPGTDDQPPRRTRYDFRTGQFEILE